VPPKTASAVREIPLAPQLARLLLAHKHATAFDGADDFVFATGCGTPFGHRNVQRRALEAAVARAGLAREGEGRLRFHDLRHTFASHPIIDLRLDVAQVSRILGHASTSITLDTYTHLFAEAAHRADIRAQMAQRVPRPPCAVCCGSKLHETAVATAHRYPREAHAAPDRLFSSPHSTKTRYG
jgi:integrase